MRTLTITFLLAIAFVGLMGHASDAAVISLKDGSQIQGTIVSATARDVEVHTENGTLTIRTDRIANIQYSESAPSAAPPELVSVVRRPLPQASYRQSVSLGLGASIPFSRIDFGPTGGGSATNGGPGFLIDGRYLYGITSKLSVGGDLSFFNRSGSDSQNLLPFSDTDAFGHSLVALGLLKYSFLDQGYTRPYLLGGLGVHRTATLVEARPAPGFVWSDTDTDETRTLVDDVRSGLATTLRLGLDFVWEDPLMFSVEMGWTHLSAPSYPATLAGQDLGLPSVTGNQDAFMVSARWGWRF